jgi:DNA-binding Xre family transcriptional regulator
MAVSYKKMFKLMIDKDITKTQLREATKISSSTFAKISKSEYVALDVLVRICGVLHCDIGDVCEVIHDDETNGRDTL